MQSSRSVTYCEIHVQIPPLDPDVADTAPSDSVLTVYDEEHFVTYLRLLDADAEGADWRDVARLCSISIRRTNQIALGGRSTAIYRAPNGWQSTGTGTCYVVVQSPLGCALIGAQAVRLIFPALVKRKCVRTGTPSYPR
jgi:hypothetical protein